LLQPQDLASKQTVDTARALVDQLAAQVNVDQAIIDNARTQLDYTRITSPINGRTGIRLIDPGNIVHAAGTTGIVVVTQVQPISVIFTLPEEDLSAVGAALAAGPVPVTTLSRDGNTELDQGTLTLIDNQIDQATGTAKFKATFSNTRNTLWPGQYVNARLLVRTDRNALTLPTAAVQLGPNGPFTYVFKSDSTVEVRALQIGDESGGLTVIKSGIGLNERVVTSNQYRLQAGVHVRDNTANLPGGANAVAETNAAAPAKTS
jgi:multidrug efflux system membrane fusion protein